MTRGILALCALALGCGGSDGGDDEPERPSSCEQGEVAGTYYFTAETVDGSCGEQNSGLISLGSSAGSGSGSGCVNLNEPVISENGCKLEVHQLCPFEDIEPGATIETTTIWRNQGGGEVIAGTMTMIIRWSDETLACAGTYRVRAERQ
jgi:hypothetical protein